MTSQTLRILLLYFENVCKIEPMKRLALLLVLIVLPLQATWAAVSAYCTHENGVSSQHFGHHFHKHRASASDLSGGDPSRGNSGPDNDCGFCHLNLKLAHSTLSMPQADVDPQLDGCSRLDLYSSFVPQGPERPKWCVSA